MLRSHKGLVPLYTASGRPHPSVVFSSENHTLEMFDACPEAPWNTSKTGEGGIAPFKSTTPFIRYPSSLYPENLKVSLESSLAVLLQANTATLGGTLKGILGAHGFRFDPTRNSYRFVTARVIVSSPQSPKGSHRGSPAPSHPSRLGHDLPCGPRLLLFTAPKLQWEVHACPWVWSSRL